MQFKQQSSAQGDMLVISDIKPGEWSIIDIAGDLTIGDVFYEEAIKSFNGLLPSEPYADVIALPVGWLNDAGKSYYNSAGPSKAELIRHVPLSLDVTGGASKVLQKKYGGFTVLQLGLLGVGALLLISSFAKGNDE